MHDDGQQLYACDKHANRGTLEVSHVSVIICLKVQAEHHYQCVSKASGSVYSLEFCCCVAACRLQPALDDNHRIGYNSGSNFGSSTCTTAGPVCWDDNRNLSSSKAVEC
jgi:hypothetical protein